MATATQSYQFSNIAATTAPFAIKGGSYGLSVEATFGGGNVQLQLLGPGGSTFRVNTARSFVVPPNGCPSIIAISDERAAR